MPATITTTEMELSPMQITFNGTDLGASLGGVTISAAYKKSPLLADQSGSTVRDRRVSGIEITVKTELAQVQNKDLWGVVFPHITKEGTGTGSLAAIDFKDAIGQGDQSNAFELVLHPLSKDALDLSTDYTFYKAVASAESEIVYGPEEQAKLSIVWNILPDESATPNKFFRYGDPAVV
jgi:hypothetical protein